MGNVNDAYTMLLKMPREKCMQIEEEELDKMIKENYDYILGALNRQLESSDDFKIRIRAESDMNLIKQHYSNIKDANARRIYNEHLDSMKAEKQRQNNRQESLSQNYDMSNLYNSRIIRTMPYRCEKKGKKYQFMDKNENPIYIKQTATIAYDYGVYNKNLSEYEIEKFMNDKKAKFTVYTDISIIDLSVDREGNPKVNPEYYNFVMDVLLSDESLIENCKYNYGYLGIVKNDQIGNYYVDYETDQLSAVYKYSGVEHEVGRDIIDE